MANPRLIEQMVDLFYDDPYYKDAGYRPRTVLELLNKAKDLDKYLFLTHNWINTTNLEHPDLFQMSVFDAKHGIVLETPLMLNFKNPIISNYLGVYNPDRPANAQEIRDLTAKVDDLIRIVREWIDNTD
jgi:hypothetical protein